VNTQPPITITSKVTKKTMKNNSWTLTSFSTLVLGIGVLQRLWIRLMMTALQFRNLFPASVFQQRFYKA
ncbi:hypothetical protein A2U01_0108996, partial [Trifolium medium]|nr:hypothetical protein [Trifolium medium]